MLFWPWIQRQHLLQSDGYVFKTGKEKKLSSEGMLDFMKT